MDGGQGSSIAHRSASRILSGHVKLVGNTVDGKLSHAELCQVLLSPLQACQQLLHQLGPSAPVGGRQKLDAQVEPLG